MAPLALILSSSRAVTAPSSLSSSPLVNVLLVGHCRLRVHLLQLMPIVGQGGLPQSMIENFKETMY